MSSVSVVLAESNGLGIFSIWGAGILLGLIQLVGYWKVVEKAGESGAWSLLFLTGCLAALGYVPACRLSGRPAWWALLLFIPVVNIVVLVILTIDVARSFGKGVGYGVGLLLLGFVFYPMLGFGSAAYVGPSGPERA